MRTGFSSGPVSVALLGTWFERLSDMSHGIAAVMSPHTAANHWRHTRTHEDGAMTIAPPSIYSSCCSEVESHYYYF